MEEFDEKQQREKRRNIRSVPPPPQLHPWLMFIHGKNGQNQTFYSLSENCVYVKSIQKMRRKLYAGSYFGWMIFLDEYINSNDEDCFLLNPVSMEKIQLPPWGDFSFTSCLLSAPPDDPGCIVLFMDADEVGHATLRFCKPGNADWSYQQLKIDSDGELCDAVPCGGIIYARISYPYENRLVNLDIGTSDKIIVKAQAIKVMPVLEAPLYRSRLVELSGEVFLVTFVFWASRESHHVRDIAIQKMDVGKKEFIEIESIGDRAFFIGKFCTTSCLATESGIEANTVYFTMPRDRSLYAFNLEEKSTTLILPCPDVTKDWSQPDWVLPDL